MTIFPRKTAAPRPRFSPRARFTFSIIPLALCMLIPESQAAPLLRCHVDQGGTSHIVDANSVADPYVVKPISINERFRFKAVMVGESQRIEYVKIYVYSVGEQQAVLLHQVSFLSPVPGKDAQMTPLTGIHRVYAPGLERELQYRCNLMETNA